MIVDLKKQLRNGSLVFLPVYYGKLTYHKLVFCIIYFLTRGKGVFLLYKVVQCTSFLPLKKRPEYLHSVLFGKFLVGVDPCIGISMKYPFFLSVYYDLILFYYF